METFWESDDPVDIIKKAKYYLHPRYCMCNSKTNSLKLPNIYSYKVIRINTHKNKL